MPILSGITIDLADLGANVTAAMQAFMPFFLMAAGLGLAMFFLRGGLSFIRGLQRSK